MASRGFKIEVVTVEPLGKTACSQAPKQSLSHGVMLQPSSLASEAGRAETAGEPDQLKVALRFTLQERVQSPLFTYLGDTEALADGFWVLSPKLKRGEHTLSFTGGLCQFGSNISVFDVDVTYSLTIR